MYEKINFKDRIVEKPNTYTMQANDDGTVTLIPAFGNVLQEGTLINHGSMDHVEEGIVDIYSNMQRKVLSGTTEPLNDLGEDGDIYLQYEE